MEKNIIHVMIGTKGQLTKMASVLQELDRQKIKYNFIRTGQHTKIIDQMLKTYNLREPDYQITKRKKDLENISQCIVWITQCILSGLKHKKKMWQGKRGIVLIHGDTESTLIGVILAKLSGIKVAHVEAGLRSFHVLNPFPEEIIRRITSRFSDYMFAPGKWACGNLQKEHVNGKIIDTKYNTVFDTIRYILKTKPTIELPKGKYVILAFHRKETVYVKPRLEKAVKCLELVAENHKVIFVLHKNTEYTLEKEGYLDKLKKNGNIIFKHYYDHVSFMHLVKNCTLVVTDGGSLQEETFFLDKPCLILRDRTERQEGLGQTAYISELNLNKIKYFLDNYKKFKRKEKIEHISPAKIVVDESVKIVNSMNK